MFKICYTLIFAVFILSLLLPYNADAANLTGMSFPFKYKIIPIFKIKESIIRKELLSQVKPKNNKETLLLMSVFKKSSLYNPNSNKIIIFKRRTSERELRDELINNLNYYIETAFTFKKENTNLCNWNNYEHPINSMYCTLNTHVPKITKNNNTIIYHENIAVSYGVHNPPVMPNYLYGYYGYKISFKNLKFTNNIFSGYMKVDSISISSPAYGLFGLFKTEVLHIGFNPNTAEGIKKITNNGNLSVIYNIKKDYILELRSLLTRYDALLKKVRFREKLKKMEEQTLAFYSEKIFLKQNISTTVILKPRKKVKIRIKNNSNIPETIILNKVQSVTESENIYSVLLMTVKHNISAAVSGYGCALANHNKLFVANPGADCTLKIRVSIPGFIPKMDNIILNFATV